MAVILKVFIAVYLVIFLIVTRYSCKNGIIFFWASLFIVPSLLLLNTYIISFINVYLLQIIIISISFVLHKEYRKALFSFFYNNKKPILTLIIAYISIIIFSSTVPLNHQICNLLQELLEISIIVESLIVAQKNNLFVRKLCIVLSILILCNIVYSFVCEIFLRTNFAGTPLYLLMGQEDNKYYTDMINIQRGIMDFRLQSIFAHPLSLGQYFLLLVPIFLCKSQMLNERFRWFMIILLSIGIFLSGTRGALFPLLLIIGLFLMKEKIRFVYKLILMLPFLIVLYTFMPFNFQRDVDKYFTSFATYIQFWDDTKQSKSEIEGSSMSMRFEQFEAANDEIKDNPLFGKGRIYREYYQDHHNQLHPKLLGYESFVLLKLVEQGWIGLCMFILLIFYMYRIFKKTYCNVWILQLLFIAFFLSTLMTGIRPFSFLILGMSAVIVSNQKSLSSHYTNVKPL